MVDWLIDRLIDSLTCYTNTIVKYTVPAFVPTKTLPSTYIPIPTQHSPPPRQRRLRPPLQRQISKRITRIPDIDRLARLIIIRQPLHINHDLIIRRAAVIQPQLIHGRVHVVHARVVRGLGGAAIVLREPVAHDALGARVGPVPLADLGGGGGGVDGGADVEDDDEAVVPGDVEAGAVVEEEGAVGRGGGDEGDGAGAGVVGGDGVLDEGAAGVEGVGGGEGGGEEEEDEEFEGGGVPHSAGGGCIC